MEKELLTVSEYAKHLNVSVQSVYKQLNGKLNPYLVIVDGKKMLNKRAFESSKEKKEIKLDSTNRLINNLESEVEMLKEQLQIKDKQIETLVEQISTFQRLLDQQQQLHAAAQLSLPEKSEVKSGWQFWKKDKASTKM
jgi:polyribonucleotide nucleotidyltransferase